MTTAAQIYAQFQQSGAVAVEVDVLQPADVLLDLYGEDIRARAYTTLDPLRGELMLRPDFTVPVVQMHMSGGAVPARYCYAGDVFRIQDSPSSRPAQSPQVGYELFDREDPARADAEVYGVIAGALSDAPVEPIMGDMGLLRAAVLGLETIEPRKAALLRHIWRPHRFRALMDRYCGAAPVPASRAALLAQDDPLAAITEVPGLRSRDEIAARIAVLRADAEAPPIGQAQADMIGALLALRAPAGQAARALGDMARDMPALAGAHERLLARFEALAAQGVDMENMRFEASYGRSSMEYYDGFVFAFERSDLPERPIVASGGRYDALTAVLGGGRGIPAVGAIIRPDLLEGA